MQRNEDTAISESMCIFGFFYLTRLEAGMESTKKVEEVSAFFIWKNKNFQPKGERRITMRSRIKTEKCQFFYEGFYYESPKAYATWVKEQAADFNEAKIGFLKLSHMNTAA